MLEIMKKLLITVFKFTFGNLMLQFYPLFEAFKLWSLNLVIPFCFCLVSPLLIKDLTNIPIAIFEAFKLWLVEGFRFHAVLYSICLLIVIFEDNDK